MNALWTWPEAREGRDLQETGVLEPRGPRAAEVMNLSEDLTVRRLPIRLKGDDRRVILRPFVMSNGRVRTLFERLDGLTDETVAALLAEVSSSFGDRHAKLGASFDEHFKIGVELTGWTTKWSNQRQAL